MKCPRCRTHLSELEVRTQWKYGFCKKCGGRAFAFGLLSKQVPLSHVLKLVAAARKSHQTVESLCPECRKPLLVAADQLACVNCQIFWIQNFDDEHLPKNRVPQDTDVTDGLGISRSIINVQESLGTRLKGLASAFPPLHHVKTQDSQQAPVLSSLIMICIIFLYEVPLYYGTYLPHPPQDAMRNHTIIHYVYNQHDQDFAAKAIHLGFPLSDALNPSLIKILSGFLLQLTGFQTFMSVGVVWILGTKVERRLGSFAFASLLVSSIAAGFYGTILSGSTSGANYLLGSSGGLAGILGFYFGFLFKKERLKELDLRTLALSSLIVASFYMFSQTQLKLADVTISSNSGWPWGAIFGMLTAILL